MYYVPNEDPQVKEMLATLEIDSIDALFRTIPRDLIQEALFCDDGLSEFEVKQFAEELVAKNQFPLFDSYLGAGAYEHHVPAVVGAICQKSEFLTSYTPYQAEASQGILQALFEFQSSICALTDMEVANCSLYDGASACAEALLMAMRHHKERRHILIAGSLHPHYRRVVDQYLGSYQQAGEVTIYTIPFFSDGSIDFTSLDALINDDTIAILIQSPNFFGIIEEKVQAICEKAHAHKTLVIHCGNPLAYGLYNPPGVLGADIAVGDCQPFGHSLNYGGPYVGYIACKQKLVRQLPGRLVGKTVDMNGNPGYVLTLQTREQHIRREKATSNICTSQTLAALASLVTMLWYGKKGLRALALTNYQRTAYLKEHLEDIRGFHSVCGTSFFNEFVIKVDGDMDTIIRQFRKEKIEAGIHLESFFPHLHNHLLIAVTETKSKQQLDRFIEVAKSIVSTYA